MSTLLVWALGAGVLRATLLPAQVCPPITSGAALAHAAAAVGWMERARNPDGSYVYEYNAPNDEQANAYNIVRHAGVTMALYQYAAITGETGTIPPADRALGWMESRLMRRDSWAAITNPDGIAETGAASLMLVGLEQRRLATGDTQYDELMHELGRFLLLMQQPDGAMSWFWDPSSGQPNPTERSTYATGEAFWALTLMERMFPGEGWDRASHRVADYISNDRDRVEHQDFPPWADQWAAYGLAEMAAWPGQQGPALNEGNIRYARSLAERFGFLVRVESQRRDTWWSDLLHGQQARGAGMGTWVEALASLWRLAAIEPRMRDMQTKIGERAACSAGILANRQYTEAKAQQYADPALVSGAWFRSGWTRMDDQQHSMSGILRTREILETRGSR